MTELFKHPMVLDGSMGTRLVEMGCSYIEGNPLWSAAALLKDPQKVVRVHCEYLAAGATILETNTYQCALSNLVKYHGCSRDMAQDVLRLGVRLARQAIETHCVERGVPVNGLLIAGSVGPYGTVLHDCSEYNGRYIDTVQPELVKDYFSSQIEVLCSAGVDLLAIETLPSLHEARIAADIVSKLSNVPTWISFSCKEECLTNYGDPFGDVISELNQCSSIAAIGLNCTHPKEITNLLTCSPNRKPTVVYPNSGSVSANHACKDRPSFAAYANEWMSHGAKVIGGNDVVCGITAVPPNIPIHYPGRIINGWEATPHSIPWQVRVKTTVLPGLHTYCGGSLIQLEKGNGTDLVLTAAHCVHFAEHWLESQQIEVTAGIHDLHGKEQYRKSVMARSFKGSSNEDAYDHNSVNNDFVVIKLEQQVPHTPHTRPICLPNPNEPLPFNKICYTSGWGTTNANATTWPSKLMQVEAQIFPYEMCDRQINNKTMLCAGLLGEPKSACFGDSGGPLACETDNAWFLYGIVSWGRRCASWTEPVIYTRVPYFVDHIREIGKIL
uniref:Hcy-binding domain-containing protein n=1 Tax=Trichuris muris TaxID=70415 RepID=A0A5S6QPD9_TRIMR